MDIWIQYLYGDPHKWAFDNIEEGMPVRATGNMNYGHKNIKRGHTGVVVEVEESKENRFGLVDGKIHCRLWIKWENMISGLIYKKHSNRTGTYGVFANSDCFHVLMFQKTYFKKELEEMTTEIDKLVNVI